VPAVHQCFSDSEIAPSSRIARQDSSVLPLWSPILPPAPAPPVPRQRPGGGGGGVRLSLEHNDSTAPQKITCGSLEPEIPKAPPSAKVWADGSIAYVPGIQFLSRAPERLETWETGIRGIVTRLSEASRCRIERFLHTVRKDAPAYTLVLTCPGVWSPSWNAYAKVCFLKLLKQMTSSRDSLISETGAFWKQELQAREAVHFHFILWHVDKAGAEHVQEWLARRWNKLVCVGLHPKDVAAHLRWHLDHRNCGKVKDMARYFAKYSGKDADAVLMRDPIPGRWWGKINSAYIPFSVVEDTTLSHAASVHAHRIARKIRQVRSNAAKHYSICKQMGLILSNGPDMGKPVLSQFEVLNRKQSGKRMGFFLDMLEATGGKRFGKAKLPHYLKMAPVYLTGPTAPATVQRILTYALAREVEEFDDIPY